MYPFLPLLSISTMTLATRGPDGTPHAAPVYFAASEDLRFYFFSEPGSQHAQDLAADQRAAAAFYPEVTDWQDIRGVQMRGEVSLVSHGAEWETAWERYAAKFPFVRSLKAVVERNELFVFVPHWVRMVDNRLGFGFKQEWDLP
jgi:uncharacterized protein YhbP (UPF0306 family)